MADGSLQDEALIARVCEGDPAALGDLSRRHRHRVLALAYRMLGDWHLAEDIAQETFIRLHQAACTYRPEAKFTTWLYRIVYNLTIDQQRKRATAPVSLDAMESQVPGVSQALPAEQQEMAVLVQKAIAHLPERQRQVILLHRYEELSHTDIARVTGWSQSAVESLLVRAYANLREQLKSAKDSLT
jgi:RNA polymerase sigma-70 factor, ECF subfamily